MTKTLLPTVLVRHPLNPSAAAAGSDSDESDAREPRAGTRGTATCGQIDAQELAQSSLSRRFLGLWHSKYGDLNDI